MRPGTLASAIACAWARSRRAVSGLPWERPDLLGEYPDRPEPDAGVIRIAYRVALGAEDSPLDWWRYATWQLGSDLLVAPLAERWIDQRFEAQPEVHKRGGRVLLSWADEYRDFLEALPLTHLFNAELDREVATVLRGESLETVRLEAEASGARLQRLASELASVQFPPVPAPFSQVRSILSAVQRSEALES